MALTSFDQELVSEIVHAVKYRGQSAAGKWLGRRMAVGLPAWMLGGEYVFCAVPLHWWREWQRGFNQARLLLLGVVDFCGVREEAVLIKKRPSIAQARSGRRRRFANLVGVFAAKGDVAGARVVLVDDVATTGATLNAAARELKLAGARRVWGAVLARR